MELLCILLILLTKESKETKDSSIYFCDKTIKKYINL